MVSLSERDPILNVALSDRELAPYAKFVFGVLEEHMLPRDESDPHIVLLRSILNKNGSVFADRLRDLRGRTISSDSEWVENDCLVFLILLGSEVFGKKSDAVDAILTARERNRNPVAVSTNSVFRSLSRREFGIEGNYAFIKVVYLALLKRLELSHDARAVAYESTSRPGLLSELDGSPFLQVLAIRAFDLLICKCAPSTADTIADAINTIYRLSPTVTLYDYCRLVGAVPGKLLFAAIATLVSVGIFIGGVGYHAFTLNNKRDSDSRSRVPSEVGDSSPDAVKNP